MFQIPDNLLSSFCLTAAMDGCNVSTLSVSFICINVVPLLYFSNIGLSDRIDEWKDPAEEALDGGRGM